MAEDTVEFKNPFDIYSPEEKAQQATNAQRTIDEIEKTGTSGQWGNFLEEYDGLYRSFLSGEFGDLHDTTVKDPVRFQRFKQTREQITDTFGFHRADVWETWARTASLRSTKGETPKLV